MIINEINNTLKLGSMHIENTSPVAEIHRSKFWDDKEYVKKVLTDLIQMFNHVDEFQFDNETEIYKFYQNTDVFEFINDIFKKNGVYDKLIFTDNNLSYNPTNINYRPQPFFLGLCSPNNKIIEPRKFDKKFLFLNRVNKRHRFEIFKFLKWTDILNESVYTFDSNNIESPYYKEIKVSSNLKISNGIWDEPQFNILPDYLNTFCNIVGETNFGYSDMDYMFEGTHNAVFITEKTEKCFVAGQPFVMVSTPYFLKKLKELGFKTFDKWWDESYDNEENSFKRLDKIGETIKQINSYSITELEQIYQEMIPILQHNQNLNNEWCDINSKDVRYFYKFKEFNENRWTQWNVNYNDDGILEKREINPKLSI